MDLGGKLLSGAAVLALAACAADKGTLTVRPTSNMLSTASRPVPARIAEGHAQLTLGNAGLALEHFRTALREDPASAEANAGIAMCYDRMNRFDLSRRYYEAALAIAPADEGLLQRFAASLDRQGARAEAAGVRREIAMRHEQAVAASAVGLVTDAVEAAAIAAPVAAPVTTVAAAPVAPQRAPAPVAVRRQAPAEQKLAAVVSAPRAAPVEPVAVAARAPVPAAPIAAPVAVAAPTAKPVAPAAAPAPVVALATAVVPAPAVAAPPNTLAKPPVIAPTRVLAVAPHAPASSVTVALPQAAPAPAAPASPVKVASAPVKAVPTPVNVASAPAKAVPTTVNLAPAPVDAAPVMPAIEQHVPVRPATETSPRLERMSPVEVALVTKGVPQWQPRVLAQSARSTTIRFVPLKSHGQAMASVQLLNAARHRGLAARTRHYLAAKGWRRLAIGDAPETRETSIIYYPESRRRTAEVLAAQFRIRVARRVAEGSAIVMLLGRDAARARASGSSA